MRQFSCWVVVLAVGIASALILVFNPGGGQSTPTREVAESYPEIGRERERLELASASVRQRMDYKEDLIRQLIAGKRTLRQVSDEFLRVNQLMEMPEVMNQIRLRYPGSGDEEKIARNVLEFVETRLQPGPDADQVRERLHREFADRFGHPPGPIT